jgi:hypothetical protein
MRFDPLLSTLIPFDRIYVYIHTYIHMTGVATSLDIHTFTPQAIANTANAYARVGMLDGIPLFQHLASASLSTRTRDFSLPSISLILNALACMHECADVSANKYRAKSPPQYVYDDVASIKKNSRSTDSDKNMIIIEHEKDDNVSVSSQTDATNSSKKLMGSDYSQDVSFTSNSTMLPSSRSDRTQWITDVFHHLAQALLEIPVQSYTPREAAIVANAVARVMYNNETLLQHIASAVKGMRTDELSPLDVSNLANAYARLDFRDAESLSHLALGAVNAQTGHSLQVCFYVCVYVCVCMYRTINFSVLYIRTRCECAVTIGSRFRQRTNGPLTAGLNLNTLRQKIS